MGRVLPFGKQAQRGTVQRGWKDSAGREVDAQADYLFGAGFGLQHYGWYQCLQGIQPICRVL
jgi:hypothetical protein